MTATAFAKNVDQQPPSALAKAMAPVLKAVTAPTVAAQSSQTPAPLSPAEFTRPNFISWTFETGSAFSWAQVLDHDPRR